MSDDDCEEIEIETYEVPAETIGIRHDGNLVVYADNGATDIAVIVPEAGMEGVVRRYLERNPTWGEPTW